MTAAALGLAATQTFGTFPGRVPAFLHEAYPLAQGSSGPGWRSRSRARGPTAATRRGPCTFAAEALAEAESRGDAALLAQALDAQLLVHWGPDDLDERLRITARLEDTVAHVDRRRGADVGPSVAPDDGAGVPGRADDPAPAACAGRARRGVRRPRGCGSSRRRAAGCTRCSSATSTAAIGPARGGGRRDGGRRGRHLRDRAHVDRWHRPAAGDPPRSPVRPRRTRRSASTRGSPRSRRRPRACGSRPGSRNGPASCCTSWPAPTSAPSHATSTGC